MYQPQYSITDKLLNAVVKLEVDKNLLANAEISATNRASLKDEVKTLNLFHLAHLIGMGLTVKDAQKIAEGRKLELEGPRARVLVNFRNILEFNRSSVAESYVDADIALLSHLNKLILNNWKEAWDVKVRSIGEAAHPDMDMFYIESQVSVADMNEELVGLSNWFKLSAGSVHPLIRVSVLFARLVELKPFSYANSLTALAAVDFLLTRMGYSANTYLPFMRTFDVYSDSFRDALQSSLGSGDMSVWIEYMLRHLSKDVHELKIEIDKKVGAEQEKNAKQPFLDLNKRQLKILKYLQTIPTVKREDYCQMMDVSTMTAYRDLDDLVTKKLIKVEGRGRGTKYMLISR